MVAWFASPVNRSVVERLRAAGLHLSEPGAGGRGRRPALPQTLEGRSVVVTGTLEGYTRDEAEAAVLARGGKSPGTVSKKTYAVVVGRAPGASKVTKAEQLGVPVVTGDRFEAFLATGELPGAGADSRSAPGPGSRRAGADQDVAPDAHSGLPSPKLTILSERRANCALDCL